MSRICKLALFPAPNHVADEAGEAERVEQPAGSTAPDSGAIKCSRSANAGSASLGKQTTHLGNGDDAAGTDILGAEQGLEALASQRFVPENLTRSSFELGWSPSAASREEE